MRNVPDRRTDVQRALRELGDHLRKAVVITANGCMVHIQALYAVYLMTNKNTKEVITNACIIVMSCNQCMLHVTRPIA
jgi:hypothetical protein